MKYEVRSTMGRKDKIMLTETPEEYTGFRSIYGYDDSAVEYILENKGRTSHMHGYRLYSDTLFLDVDDNDTAAEMIKSKLLSMGVGFDMYHTGNRGYHFHIPIKPMYGADTAFRQKNYVKETFPGADTSIYKTTGVIRLPGTFHFKCPGKCKRLIFSAEGDTLEVKSSYIPIEGIYMDEFDRENVIDRLNQKFMTRCFEGIRNRYIYNLAFLCKLAEMDYDSARSDIFEYNNNMVIPPLPLNEVELTVKSAYRR